MKLLFLLFIILLIGTVTYYYFPKNKHKKNSKKINIKSLIAAITMAAVLLILVSYGMYTSATAQDNQCILSHVTNTKHPANLKTAYDFFAKGNYDYDIGKCKEAITSYSKAIALNKNFYQAYNNRAYTNMRMRNYQEALPDLDKAIQLKPDYVQALMNRGDIHNYYYNINRQQAIDDYKRVISVAGDKKDETSVCGHLFLAEHNGWNIGTFIGLLTGQAFACV
jgi:tetratricopeptide (TPR) repeat protein